MLIFFTALPRKLFTAPTSYVIEDADGNLLNATIAADGQWRFPYDENVPHRFIDCITTYEDRRFYSHAGVDLSAIVRAAKADIQGAKTTEGASTISMQVIRLAEKNDSRNIWNKIKESLLAVRLELSFSKAQIMALYASNAPFGSNVVGLDAAAWRYFGRDAAKLSWAESAMLAVLPNAPSLVHPGRNREILLQKRNMLLDALCSIGSISPEDASLAKQEPLPAKPLALPQNAPHLLQRFKTENGSGDTKIKTTIDGALQLNVADIVARHEELLKSNGINNMCALVLDVETGKTLAYVGNIFRPEDKSLESDVDVINSPRSPGSALKPILYAAMLSDGDILPNSLVPDIPTQIGGYTPQNFDLGYDGAVPASRALSRSLNIPAVKLLQQYKYQRFYELLKRCGITTLKNPADFYGLSLILGGCEVKMWDLAGVYASLARVLNHQTKNHGLADPNDFHPPVYFTAPVTSQPPNPQSVPLDATSIWFTFRAMQEVMRPGEEGLWQEFASSQQVAWKTGTSFGFRDAWAVGVTPRYVVAVWAGNTSGEGRAGLIGVHTAAPAMFDIFRLLPQSNWFSKPEYNYVRVPVCRQSGFRAGPDCADADTLLMPPNALHTPLCPYHKIIRLDAAADLRVNESCELPADMREQSWFILPPSMEFYYKQRNADYKIPPPFRSGCLAEETQRIIEFIYPAENAKIFIPKEINGSRGKTVFTAASRDNEAKIFWTLDNSYAGTTQHFHRLALSPAKGVHFITLTDEQGNSVTRRFEIVDDNHDPLIDAH